MSASLQTRLTIVVTTFGMAAIALIALASAERVNTINQEVNAGSLYRAAWETQR